MEGKAVLFKKFAKVNAIDIEVDTKDPEELIRTVKLLEPSFGGVNLEGERWKLSRNRFLLTECVNQFVL